MVESDLRDESARGKLGRLLSRQPVCYTAHQVFVSVNGHHVSTLFPKIRCWANFQQIVSFQSVQFCLVCKILLEKSHLKVDLFKEKQAGQKRLLQYMSMSWMTLRQPELTARRLGLGSTWLSSWSNHLTRYCLLSPR